MRSVTAYATTGPNVPFEKTTIERRDLGASDVLVQIAFAGICHSDIHTARGEWGEVHFPLVPGHEIAGTVEAVGAAVTTFAVGDRVGVGVMVDSCRTCENCADGNEQYCLEGFVGTYDGVDKDGRHTDGGYSTHIVVDEHFVAAIPDGIGLDEAAPLLCAGITLYSPLRHWKAGPGKKVAIIGLGGLGHMGVKLAAAMGADVTVLSQSLAKQDDGTRMGASAYYATSDPSTFETLHRAFDLIINTVSVPLPIDDYLSMLKLDGALVMVGLPPGPLEVTANALMDGRRSFAASGIGGMAETQDMLNFCAEHGIGADIETISGDAIDTAWDRVVDSDVRYRFVIDVSTF